MDILSSLEQEAELQKVLLEDLQEVLDHGILVSNLAAMLSREMGKDEKFCYDMAQAGLIHDIGKLKLSKYLYEHKNRKLGFSERKYVRIHSTFSYEILKNYDYPPWILQAVCHHHENYDGTGYPDNLKGEEIPFAARILRTCDVFAALIANRPYREAFDFDTAMDLMIDEAKNFDLEIFLAFMKMAHSEEFEKIKALAEHLNK